MVGVCIIGSLLATSIWGPVGGHGLISHDLNMVCNQRWFEMDAESSPIRIASQIRAERRRRAPESEGSVPGEVEAIAAPEDSDHYVVVKKHENGGGEGNPGNGQRQQ